LPHEKRDDLIDAEVGVWRNDGSPGEVDTLAGQVAAEATLLALEALAEAVGVEEEMSRTQFIREIDA